MPPLSRAFLHFTHPSRLMRNNPGGFWYRWTNITGDEIFTTIPEIFQLESFLQKHPRSPMDGTAFTFTLFCWFSHSLLSFTLKISWVGHLLLFWTKKQAEGRFWAKTGSNIQLGELRMLALVAGLNLTLVFKLQPLSVETKEQILWNASKKWPY